jgi:large subunit ribosomal protein L15
MADGISTPALHELRPAEGSHRTRKRVGRGAGAGTGKTSGRGQKGQKSRSGSHSMRPGFEGGQMPLYMRLGKLRGPNHRKSMPMGPFRTHTTPVNLRDLERFDAGVEVTPELLKTAGVVKSLRHPVKILGDGELTRVLTVRAHAFSKRAVELIEAAGGTVVVIPGGPNPNNSPSSKTRAANRKSAAAADAAAEPAPKAAAAPVEEAVAEEPAEEPAAESEPESEPDPEE